MVSDRHMHRGAAGGGGPLLQEGGSSQAPAGDDGIFRRFFGSLRARRSHHVDRGGDGSGGGGDNLAEPPPGFVRANCGHCGVLIQAPENVSVIKCGACNGVCEIKYIKQEAPDRSHDGYLDPACCVSKITSCLPKETLFYLAIALTSYIIGSGFIIIAPQVFPGPNTMAGAAAWGVSMYISLVVVYNYRMGATVDPGRPAAVVDELGAGVSCCSEGGCQMCKECGTAKPKRCHHCSTCNRCILKMDHHCVFLNNCVGQDNSPYFMRFLVWVATACAYVCIFSSILALKRMDDSGVSIMQIIKHGLHRGGSTGAYGYIPQVFVINNAVHCFITFAEVCGYGTMLILIVSGITCAVISTLLCYHLALAWYGKTQLEYGFGLDPGPATVKGLAGVCEAFGRRGVAGSWWVVAVFTPLPYRRGGHVPRLEEKLN